MKILLTHSPEAFDLYYGERAYLALIQEEHRRIYQAIEAADPKGAREAMRRHLTRSLERYRKLAAEQKKAA